MSLCQTWCPRCLWKPSPGGLSMGDPTLPKRSPRAAPCLPLHSSRKRAPGNDRLRIPGSCRDKGRGGVDEGAWCLSSLGCDRFAPRIALPPGQAPGPHPAPHPPLVPTGPHSVVNIHHVAHPVGVSSTRGRPWRRPLKKQQEVQLCSFSHAQEQLPQVPPAFDAAMRFAGQAQRQHVGDSDADLSTFEILQGPHGNGSQALWVLLAETANAKAEDGLVRSLQGVDRLHDVGTSRGIAKEHQPPQRREHLHAPAKHLAADRFQNHINAAPTGQLAYLVGKVLLHQNLVIPEGARILALTYRT